MADRRLSRAALIAAACSWSCACDMAPGTPQHEARQAVTGLLFDPGSAQFRYMVTTADSVCGTINAKNRMGGYVGARAFVFDRATKAATVYSGRPESYDVQRLTGLPAQNPDWTANYHELANKCAFPAMWKQACGADLPDAGDDHICKLFTGSHDDYDRLMREYGG